MFHTIVRITLFGSGEISSADQIGGGPDLVSISTQSSSLLSHLDMTRLPGTMRTPSTYTSDTALTRNPSLFRLFSLFPTDQFSCLSLSLYSIWVNWAIRISFRIGPPKDDRTSSKVWMAQVRIPSGSRPVFPAAILSRRFLNHPKKWGFPPTTLREDLQGGSWTGSGSLLSSALSGTPTYQTLSSSLSLPFSLCKISQSTIYINHCKRESKGLQKYKWFLFEWEKKSGYNSGERTTLVNPLIQP